MRQVAWARQHMTWKAEWKQTLFSDEKKFNLHGRDSGAYYWHDLRKEEKIFSNRQQGGQSLMVWAGFGYRGQTNIAFPEGWMNATDYQELLDIHLLPFWRSDWMSILDIPARQCFHSRWKLNLGMDFVEWGTYNGMARIFAGSESQGEPLGYFVSHCVCWHKTV